MDAVVRGAEPLHVPVVPRHRVRGDPVARAPVPVDQLGGDRGSSRQLVHQAEPGVLPRRVGRQRDGGTDLGQRRCLFEDVGRDTALAQREPEGQPPDPGADHDDPQLGRTHDLKYRDGRERLAPDEHLVER